MSVPRLTEFQRQCRKALAEPYHGDNPTLHALQKESAAILLAHATQKRERFEEEVWCAHRWLDERGMPRSDVGGEVFSLVGRMMRLVQKAP